MKQRLNSTLTALLITLAIVAAAAVFVFFVSPPRYSPGPETKSVEFTPPQVKHANQTVPVAPSPD